MTLSLSDTFDKRRFLLDEPRLRKVVEVATKRLNKGGHHCKVEYKLERKDSSEYSTGDIDEVLSESNVGSTRIRVLIVGVQATGNVISLRFAVGTMSAPSFVSLSIKGDDRDLVMLVGADLREYIDAEILVRHFPTRSFAIVPAILCYYSMILLRSDKPSSSALPSVNDVLKNPDLSVKLNYRSEE